MRMPADSKLPLLVAALAALATASCTPIAEDLGELNGPERALSAQPPAATVVLVHGMGGFKKLGPLDYFFRVPGLWKKQGARVYVASETSFASIEARAAELKAQLDQLPGPLVIVGHSQGGLDARYLISKLDYARRVRALVTIATPHRGSPIADVAMGIIKGPVEDVLNVLIGELGWTLEGAHEITTRYMHDTFNPSVPDAGSVTYWSYAGQASPLGLERGSGWLHAVLLPTWTIMTAEGIPSDGIVPVASQRWGQYQGTIPGDHVGEVNQPLGETPGFNALRFYSGLLQRMHDAGW